MVDKPFDSANAFNAELERVLYDGDYSPTTFNMAFFMHTIFRKENEQDNQAMKDDQSGDFSQFAPDEAVFVGVDSGKKKKNMMKLLA
jgi:hypothetical protein